MKKIRIHLSQPFEEILATVLSLPKASGEGSDTASDGAEELKQLIRGLYEAANGRQVETILGLIPIAPPVAPFLKDAEFCVESQLEFLVEATSRVIAHPAFPEDTTSTSAMNGHRNGQSVGERDEVRAEAEEARFPSSFVLPGERSAFLRYSMIPLRYD